MLTNTKVELHEYVICNYPGKPHVAAAIWPCIYFVPCWCDWVLVVIDYIRLES